MEPLGEQLLLDSLSFVPRLLGWDLWTRGSEAAQAIMPGRPKEANVPKAVGVYQVIFSNVFIVSVKRQPPKQWPWRMINHYS